jgi:hypothetical protein
VCGFNVPGHRKAVRELVVVENPSIVCLQETKLHVLNDFLVMEILAWVSTAHPCQLIIQGVPSWWHGDLRSGHPPLSLPKPFLYRLGCSTSRSVRTDMGIYGPSRDHDKPEFLAELEELCHLYSGPWLLTGDFNLIYCAGDKSNDHLDR